MEKKHTECGSWCGCYDPETEGCEMPSYDRVFACKLYANDTDSEEE